MFLEDEYFKYKFIYNYKFVNKCIMRSRFSKNRIRKDSYKNLVWKMMVDIVKKNIFNYTNLLRGINLGKYSIPDTDELISTCYIKFSECLDKYIVKKNNNFYFYFNKSLSRFFYRSYQKQLQRKRNVEMTNALTSSHIGFHVSSNNCDSSENLLLDSLRLNNLEKKICESRMKGQRTSEFLKENITITPEQYSGALKRIKKILLLYKKKGEI